jgi:hypothetical protein
MAKRSKSMLIRTKMDKVMTGDRVKAYMTDKGHVTTLHRSLSCFIALLQLLCFDQDSLALS